MDGRSHDVTLAHREDHYTVVRPGARSTSCSATRRPATRASSARGRPGPCGSWRRAGKLVRLLVAAEQEVAAGQGLLVMEP